MRLVGWRDLAGFYTLGTCFANVPEKRPGARQEWVCQDGGSICGMCGIISMPEHAAYPVYTAYAAVSVVHTPYITPAAEERH
jgi:hypothetical protein